MLHTNDTEDFMLQIIKIRKDTEQVCAFLSSFKTDKKICVPKLYDGTFETALASNNTLECIPADDNFQILWQVCRDQPALLSRFIEIYKTEEESSTTLSEILKVQTNNIPRAYTLLSLCLRSDETSLMGGQLINKENVFTLKYLQLLKKYKPPFNLVEKQEQDSLIFQDLTYLTLQETESFKNTSNYLLITNKKEHMLSFDGANCSQIGEYFLIWN